MSMFPVILHGQTLHTQADHPMRVPTQALAERIVQEWQSGQSCAKKRSGPLTQLADAALDAMPEARAFWVEQALRHAQTDLLCHLAPGPQALTAYQEKHWKPVRDWAATLGIVLQPVSGVIAKPQRPKSLEALGRRVQNLGDFHLAGFVRVMAITSSALLALAMTLRHLDGHAVFAAAQADEDWQRQQWGDDAEARARAETSKAELITLQDWFTALDEAG